MFGDGVIICLHDTTNFIRILFRFFSFCFSIFHYIWRRPCFHQFSAIESEARELEQSSNDIRSIHDVTFEFKGYVCVCVCVYAFNVMDGCLHSLYFVCTVGTSVRRTLCTIFINRISHTNTYFYFPLFARSLFPFISFILYILFLFGKYRVFELFDFMVRAMAAATVAARQ